MAENIPRFREGWVEADGFRIRYMQGGDGPPLVYLHGAGGLRLTRAHDLLSRHHRVIAFEMPGFGASAENRRTPDIQALASTMAAAAGALGLDTFQLMGTSFGGTVALWLAVRHQERVLALILEAPAAIRLASTAPVSGSPEEIARRLYAHPERVPPLPVVDPDQAARTLAFVRRLRGPDRDTALEAAMGGLPVPALVLFGTLDSVIPPDAGRIYKDLMPNAHLSFVYDAGHEIGAERPEAFADAVLDFLERGDAFAISRTTTVILP